MRKPSEQINLIVFDVSNNNAMYVYRLSMVSENCIIFGCLILFTTIAIDSCLFSILGTSSVNQHCRIYL